MLPNAGPARLDGVAECDLLRARAVEDELLDALVEHFPRLLDVEAVVLRQRLQHGEIEMVAPVPAADGAARERQVRMGDDALRIEELHGAEAIAARTCA